MMNTSTTGERSRARLLDWLDKRLPIRAFIESQLTDYYPPKNLNAWYYFGVMALVVLGIQLLTGIFLAMHYKPGVDTAHASIEHIMREVEWGWLIRYGHSTGASFFFIVVYLHMFRSLMYGSYRAPREVLWTLGMLIYLALMAEAFMGYVLPWGNMSYWAAQVIINLFGTIPVVGAGLVEWIRGDYAVADATLGRFFSLHVIAVPLGLLLLVTLHLVALRSVGSNNPEGIEVKDSLDAKGRPLDGIAFHPYYIEGPAQRRGVPRGLHVRVVLRADLRRTVPRAREFRTGESDVDAGAHRARVVLRALLRHPAGGARSTRGCAVDAVGRRLVPVPAVARPLAGPVDALQGRPVAAGPRAVRVLVHGAGNPGTSAGRNHGGVARAGLHGGLLRLLLAHAHLLPARPDEDRARAHIRVRRAHSSGWNVPTMSRRTRYNV